MLIERAEGRGRGWGCAGVVSGTWRILVEKLKEAQVGEVFDPMGRGSESKGVSVLIAFGKEGEKETRAKPYPSKSCPVTYFLQIGPPLKISTTSQNSVTKPIWRK
jgi:hypothetical protein